MGRKKKLINRTDVPQLAIKRFACCMFDVIWSIHDSEEGQREFAVWQVEQAKKAELNGAPKKHPAGVLFCADRGLESI